MRKLQLERTDRVGVTMTGAANKHEHWLSTDERLRGKWVAFNGSNTQRVVGFGRSPTAALRQAERNGAKHPFVVHIPKKPVECFITA